MGQDNREWIAREGRSAGEHFIADNTQRVDVTAIVGLETARLFWRHVDRRADQSAGAGNGCRAGRLYQTEICEIDSIALSNQDITRLDISMHQILAMCIVESRSDLGEDSKRAVWGKCFPLLLQYLIQRLTIDELHGDVVKSILFPNLIDVDDVGVIQAGGSLRLTLQAFNRGSIAGEVGKEKLEGDKAIQTGLFSFMDDCHTAATDLRNDPILTNRLTNQTIHRKSPNVLVYGAYWNVRTTRLTMLLDNEDRPRAWKPNLPSTSIFVLGGVRKDMVSTRQ